MDDFEKGLDHLRRIAYRALLLTEEPPSTGADASRVSVDWWGIVQR